MSLSFDFIVTRNPIDGVRIALDKLASDDREHLLAVTFGGSEIAHFLGLNTPPHYRGLPALIGSNPGRGTLELSRGGKTVQCVVPSGGANDSPQSELLDMLRISESRDGRRVMAVIGLQRLADDLPPMTAADTLTCYWEVRDVLTDKHIEQLTYLAERIDIESPAFNGFQLYSRTGTEPREVGDRLSAIASASGMNVSGVIVPSQYHPR